MSPQALAARVGVMAALALAAAPGLHAQIQTARMTCGSVSSAQQTCRTSASITSVRIERDLNGKRCRAGSTWGYTSSYIWTNSGCRGDFMVSYQNGNVVPGTVNGGVAAGTTQTIHCGDLHGARVQCSAGGYITGARIVSQKLMGTCKPNETWGYASNYVWTEKMCIADFEVTYGSQNNGSYTQNGTYPNGTYPNGTIRSGTLGTRVVSCGAERANNGNGNGNGNANGNGNGRRNGRGRTVTCNAGGRIASVRLVRADNGNRCRQGNTWGWNGREIWTSNGCRGDFEVTYAAGRNR